MKMSILLTMTLEEVTEIEQELWKEWQTAVRAKRVLQELREEE